MFSFFLVLLVLNMLEHKKIVRIEVLIVIAAIFAIIELLVEVYVWISFVRMIR